jgi:small membrane protein
MIIQVVILIFIVFVISRVLLRFRAGDITSRELIVWLVFWLAVGAAVLLPQRTDVIAQWVGVERGADLMVYLSIIVLFFVLFKILVRMERIERDITKAVRNEALEDKDKQP